MNLDDYEGHTPAPWIVTRAQKNTILIASKVLGCSDCGSTEIYTHANTGGKEIQFPKSVEPDLFTIDEGKNQWGDYDMYCPSCDLLDYTKPVDATQNEIDLELIAAAPELLAEVKELRAWKMLVTISLQEGLHTNLSSHLREEMLKELIE